MNILGTSISIEGLLNQISTITIVIKQTIWVYWKLSYPFNACLNRPSQSPYAHLDRPFHHTMCIDGASHSQYVHPEITFKTPHAHIDRSFNPQNVFPNLRSTTHIMYVLTGPTTLPTYILTGHSTIYNVSWWGLPLTLCKSLNALQPTLYISWQALPPTQCMSWWGPTTHIL